MKKISRYFIALGVLLMASTGLATADDGPILYGDVIYSDNWEETSDYGVYSINTSTGTVKAVSPTGDYNFRATGGAVYRDGHFYIIKGDEYSAAWYDYNTDSWEEENESEESSTWLATDMTVNPSDNKIYAVMADGNGGQVLTTVDFDSDSRIVVGSLSNSLVTLSADAYGQLYGIGTDGVLYSVDAVNADEKAIGATGVQPDGMQSATFDYGTGNLYWAASTGMGTGALYTVDTTTGHAMLAARFQGNEQVVGLYSLSTAHQWEGPDVPEGPSNVKAVYGNGQSTITWDAPTKGLHNGDYSSTGTTYDVTRLPDSVVVAEGTDKTTCTDIFTPAQLGAYTYEVTAKNAAGTGGSAKSNTVVAGDAVVPPYTQDFTDESTFALLTTVDGDGDGSTWVPSATSKCARDAGAPFEATDDWIFTPRLALKADRLYRLRFTVSAEFAANYPYKIQAAVGSEPTEEAAGQIIQKDTTISDPAKAILGNYFNVSRDGNYNVGINVHGYDIQDILLHNILVEEGPKFAAPDSVTNVTADAAADGSAHVTLTFTAPTKTVSGKTLGSISDIKVYRGKALVAQKDDITPGNTYSVDDNGPEANAFNNYTIVAENADGEGLAKEITVYVGIDTPLPPTNVKATVDADDDEKVVLSWEAPTTGVNGGYINPDKLSYNIIRYTGDDNGNSVASGYDKTTITDGISNTGKQTYQRYDVTVQNSLGQTSTVASSNTLIKGAPYNLPFNETFPEGQGKYFWIASASPADGHAAWGTNYDYSTSKYCLQFSSSYREGDASTVSSGKISTAGAGNPVLEYKYWYRAEAGDDSLNVYMIKNGTDTVLIDDEPYTLYMNSKDFEKVTVPLSKYIDKDTKFIQIAFGLKTYNSDAIQNAAVTDIVVRDKQDYDLMAQAISAPATANAGDTIVVGATVMNYGSKRAGAFSVDLLTNGEVAATQDGNGIDADSTDVMTFKVAVNTLNDKLDFAFRVNYDNDLVDDNNTSETVTTTVNRPVYPAPADGEGTQNGRDVNITWKEPDYTQFTVPAADGAEDYEAFAADSIGEWTLRDNDGKETRNDITVDSYALNFEHQGEPMAWMVMNPEQAGAPFKNWMDEPTGWQSENGKQFFASISSREGANDDWLISPELSGEEQTITFYQHGYYGIEKYEVLYSTSDTATAHFTSLGEQTSAATWTKVEYRLPEGTKYFAIRNLGGDYSQCFFVDDITFKALSNKGVLKLNGYNIYRDGKKIGSVDKAMTSFEDDGAESGNHTYQVTAVYNLGESVPTTFEVNVATGIAEAQDRENSITLRGSVLTTRGPVSVYSLDGKLIFHRAEASNMSLPAGTYIVKSGGETRKVVIR